MKTVFAIKFVKFVDYHRRGGIMDCDIKIARVLRKHSREPFNVVLRYEILHCLTRGSYEKTAYYDDNFLPENTIDN